MESCKLRWIFSNKTGSLWTHLLNSKPGTWFALGLILLKNFQAISSNLSWIDLLLWLLSLIASQVKELLCQISVCTKFWRRTNSLSKSEVKIQRKNLRLAYFQPNSPSVQFWNLQKLNRINSKFKLKIILNLLFKLFSINDITLRFPRALWPPLLSEVPKYKV